MPLLLRTYVKLRNAPMLLRTLRRLLQNRPGDDEFEQIAEELVRDRDLLKLVAKEAASPDDAEKRNIADRERLLDTAGALTIRPASTRRQRNCSANAWRFRPRRKSTTGGSRSRSYGRKNTRSA